MLKDPKGIVFDIMKFAIHDGPGIRTTVFLKGCPLHCLWCHNPESQAPEPEISFSASNCIGCGYCMDGCPRKCHSIENGKHVFDRTKCSVCGRCTEKCYAQALEIIGREMSVEKVIEEVLKDKAFYENSGGGMTLSGGEPLFQPSFAEALLAEAKKHSIHTCVETCGFAPWKDLERLLKNTDIFLFDYKESDPEKHKEFTGVKLNPILKNLEMLDKNGASVILRCPIIPGINDRQNHLRKIAETANSLKNIIQIDIQPYHPLGKSKCERIGKKYLLENWSFPENSVIEEWLAEIRKHTKIPVNKN